MELSKFGSTIFELPLSKNKVDNKEYKVGQLNDRDKHQGTFKQCWLVKFIWIA